MAIITIFAPSHCKALECARETAALMGYSLTTDEEIAAAAARRFETGPEKIERCLSGKVSAFNHFTREREIMASQISVTVAELLKRDRQVICGNAALFFPREISHVMSVCISAPQAFRAKEAEAAAGQDGAARAIKKDDERMLSLGEFLGRPDPLDTRLYDVTLDISRHSVKETAATLAAHAAKDVVIPTTKSLTRAADFALSAHVAAALAAAGHDVGVSARDGAVTVTINKHVLMLSRLEEELKCLVMSLHGVKSVTVKVGAGFHKTDIYRKADFSMPGRVLLVDDERQFVETLSDRLQMREVGSAVVYDGEEALSFVADEEPEVMLLDLNLPGMNGIEVLRRVKKEHPGVEIIILTGHGSAKDEAVCRELGAFAYLEKPVAIDILADTMRRANEKARENRAKCGNP